VKKNCHDPGSNRGPLDLQSNALPTELSWHWERGFLFYCWVEWFLVQFKLGMD
jgi:hypothetical protein